MSRVASKSYQHVIRLACPFWEFNFFPVQLNDLHDGLRTWIFLCLTLLDHLCYVNFQL